MVTLAELEHMRAGTIDERKRHLERYRSTALVYLGEVDYRLPEITYHDMECDYFRIKKTDTEFEYRCPINPIDYGHKEFVTIVENVFEQMAKG